MLKWLITLFVIVAVIGIVQPWLSRRLWFGRLPGDLRLHWRGTELAFPFASVIVLSCFAAVIGLLF